MNKFVVARIRTNKRIFHNYEFDHRQCETCGASKRTGGNAVAILAYERQSLMPIWPNCKELLTEVFTAVLQRSTISLCGDCWAASVAPNQELAFAVAIATAMKGQLGYKFCNRCEAQMVPAKIGERVCNLCKTEAVKAGRVRYKARRREKAAAARWQKIEDLAREENRQRGFGDTL